MKSSKVKFGRAAVILTPYEQEEKKRNSKLALARRAEIITAGVEQPFWKEIILPILEAEVAQWQESLCWTQDADDFQQARGSALRAKRLLEVVLTEVGQQDRYAAEAQALTSTLSEMRKADGGS